MKMILITADLHLNDLPRDDYRNTWMRTTLPKLLRDKAAKILVILGDLSDEKDHLSSWLVNTTVDHVLRLSKICPVIILKGNHDYIEADNPFYEFLGKYDNVAWINKPTNTAAIPFSQPLLGNALLLPHTANYKRDWGPELDDYDLFFTHQTFQGAQVGPRKLDGVPTTVFPDKAVVLSGDVHVPQRVGPVVYAGAPYLCDFGDNYAPRVLLLDHKSRRVASINSPGPQKRLVEFNYPNRAIERPWTDYIKCSANKGDILKVRVTIEPAQTPQWNAIKDEVRAWGERSGYNIYLIQPQVDSSSTKSMSKRKVSSKSDEQLVQTYAGARAVSEATLNTGLNLMEKA